MSEDQYKARDRRYVRHIADGDDQDPEFGKIIEEIQLLDRVVADIQGVQIPAPAEHGDLIIAALAVPLSPKGRERRLIRAHPALAEAELASETDVRKELIQLFEHLQVQHEDRY